MDRTSAFSEALRHHRHTCGLTQEELAERAHLSERAISDLERGLKVPQRATVRLLTEALALPPDQAELFGVAARSRVEPIAGVANAPTKDKLPAALTTLVDRDQHEAARRSTNLPIQRGRLIGRAGDVDALCQNLLRDDGWLLTLVGPGGVGKTRLALEAAARLLEAHVDGVWLIDLAAVTEVELVVPTVATALGVRVELDCEPVATLLSYLAKRQLLLVLDNCEHLVEACADLVGTVRQDCAGVRVLATSREPLGIDGEVVWRLRPLEEQDAALLFVERARAQHPTVEVGEAAAVALLCRRLDRLPLAIELAAARVSVLSPSEMLRHLEDRFALLRRVGRATSLRHQTLRATVDWSYELLDAAEQQLFRRLAVFVGSFDLSSAEAMDGPGTLDRLGRLIDKSLVLAEPRPLGTRYRLLETLRQYAWERLMDASDVELARSRHLAYFLGRAEALYAPTQGLGGPLRALDSDLDNLRSAFEWCELADPAAGLRLIAATGYLWWRRSCAEGRRWADLFLARCPEPSLARAGALHAAGALEMFWDPPRSRQLEEEAAALAQQMGDRATAAIAMALAAYSGVLEENAEEAIPVLERSLTLVEGLGDARGVAWVLIILGGALITNHERREEGRQKVERALVMAAAAGESGDQAVPSFGHFLLGLYWRWKGVPGRALEHFRRALALLRNLQMVPNLSSVLLQVARLLAPCEPARAARLAGAPDRDDCRRWTYGELMADAERVAQALLGRFVPGERVAVWANSIPEWVVLEFGAALAGVTLVTVNPAYRARELEYVLDQSRAHGIFLLPEYRGSSMARILEEVHPKLRELREVVMFSDWRAFCASGSPTERLPEVRPDDPAQIQYTSGTTGFPKGAMLHHRGVTNTARLMGRCWGSNSADVWVNPLPMFHIGGCVIGTLVPVQSQGTQVLVPFFDAGLELELVEAERCTVLFGVPTMLIAMLDHPDFAARDLSSVRFTVSGGATVPPEMVQHIETKLQRSFSIIFGQTEASGVITMTRLDDRPEDRATSLGQPLPQAEVKIVDPSTQAVVPPGVIGELCTRGYQVMHGYFDNQDATGAAIDPEGWLHTGDLCSMDARGYCRIEGRLKDMIIRGENIYPREIEQLLFSYPSVADVAVVGVPDPKWGERVAAFIRPAAGQSPTADELFAFCRQHLAPHKTPRYWEFVEQFPMTPSGKIQKFVLRDRFVARTSEIAAPLTPVR